MVPWYPNGAGDAGETAQISLSPCGEYRAQAEAGRRDKLSTREDNRSTPRSLNVFAFLSL